MLLNSTTDTLIQSWKDKIRRLKNVLNFKSSHSSYVVWNVMLQKTCQIKLKILHTVNLLQSKKTFILTFLIVQKKNCSNLLNKMVLKRADYQFSLHCLDYVKSVATLDFTTKKMLRAWFLRVNLNTWKAC